MLARETPSFQSGGGRIGRQGNLEFEPLVCVAGLRSSIFEVPKCPFETGTACKASDGDLLKFSLIRFGGLSGYGEDRGQGL